MKALVLCAGLGTRLRPLTTDIAKPALPVTGIPTLWYAVWSIMRELQPERWIVNVGHAADSIHRALDIPEIKAFTKISLDLSDETSQILGSSGALKKIQSWIGNDRLLVVNGDSICFAPWRKMMEFHLNRKALLTMHIRSFESTEAYTDISIDPKGQVVSLGEKKTSGKMFSGAYIIEPELIARLPDGYSDLRPSILEPLVPEGRLFAFHENVDWFDTGSIETYYSAQFSVPAKLRAARPLIETIMQEFSPASWRPKNWGGFKAGHFDVKGPSVLVGQRENWEKIQAGVLGPNLCGVTDFLGMNGNGNTVNEKLNQTKRSHCLFFLDQVYQFEK